MDGMVVEFRLRAQICIDHLADRSGPICVRRCTVAIKLPGVMCDDATPLQHSNQGTAD